MQQSRNDSATVFKEHEHAWISGGGSSSVDKYNYSTETMRSSTFSADFREGMASQEVLDFQINIMDTGLFSKHPKNYFCYRHFWF